MNKITKTLLSATVILGIWGSAHAVQVTVPSAPTSNYGLVSLTSGNYTFKAIPSCSTASSGLTFNTGTSAFGCNSITGGGGPVYPFTTVAGGAATSTLLYLYNGVYVIGSSTVQFASSTAISTVYASSTQYFGANLTTCATALTWATGQFGCNAGGPGSASTTLLADNNTFSGVNQFINLGTTSIANLNTIYYVPADFPTRGCANNATYTDFGQCVNGLYSLASTSGNYAVQIMVPAIKVLSTQWTTPINFNINGLIASLDCVRGAVLIYGGTGTSTTFNMSNPTGHTVSDNYGCSYQGNTTRIAAGNSNSKTTGGIHFGGSNGAVGVNFHDNDVNGFGMNLAIGANAYMLSIKNNSISGGNGGMLGNNIFIAPANNSGERNVFQTNSITDPGNLIATSSIYISDAGTASNYFGQNSIDNVGAYVGSSDGMTVFDSNHWENAGCNYPGYALIYGKSSDRSTQIVFNGNEVANDCVTSKNFYTLIFHGGIISAMGNRIDNYGGGTVANFIDHSLDNGISSDLVCQTQVQGGGLTNIIAGSGGITWSLGNGGPCSSNVSNSYTTGLRPTAGNTNEFYSGSVVAGSFDHNGNWTLGVAAVPSTVTIQKNLAVVSAATVGTTLNVTGLTTLISASSTSFSSLDGVFVGRTATTSIVGDLGTSTFSSRISAVSASTTATSTMAGINLPYGGCFAVGGTCITTGGGSSSNSSTTLLADNNTFSGNDVFTNALGIGTNSPTDVNANSRLTVSKTGAVTIVSSSTDDTTSSTAILETYATSIKGYLGSHGKSQVVSRFGLTLNKWIEIGATSTDSSAAGLINGLVIGTITDAPIVFGTNNAFRMTIASTTGNVGIGATTSPYAALTVLGSSGVVADKYFATSTTATSTFLGTLSVGSTTPMQSALFSIGTSSPLMTVDKTTGNIWFDSGNLYIDSVNNRIGISSTTPGSVFAIQGVMNFTAATSSGSATGGFDIPAGCYAIRGVCVGGGGSGTVGAGLAGEIPWYAANGTTVSASSSDQLTMGRFNATSTIASNLLYASSTGLSTLGSTYLSTGGNDSAVGTTSMPLGEFTIFSSTEPQLALSSGAGIPMWEIRSDNAGNLTFSTSTVQGLATTTPPAVQMNQTGQGMGVGTTSVSLGYISVEPGITSNGLTIWHQGSSSPALVIAPMNLGGYIGIGTSTPTAPLSVQGRVFLNGVTSSGSTQTGYLCYSVGGEIIQDSIACTVSSEKFKKSITDLAPDANFVADTTVRSNPYSENHLLPLDEVMMMRPVSYDYEKTGEPSLDARGRQVGFLAEDANQIDPRLVSRNMDGTIHSFNYQAYTAVLTGAIQELRVENDKLRVRLDALEKK